MNDPFAWVLQLFVGMVLFGSYGLALADWIAAPAESLRPTRGAARAWTAAAVGLVLSMGVLRTLAFGWGEGWDWLSGDGLSLPIRAAGLYIVIQAGQRWAVECGAHPLRLRRLRWRRWPWAWLGAGLAAMLVWTALLAWLTPHHANGADLMRMLGLDKMDPWLRQPFAIALLTFAPIVEECLFRHYLLYRIAARMSRGGPARPWIGNAIVVTSLLFAVCHLGQIDPLWLKWAQIFVPGVVLGVTAWRHGLERAIALHWAYNISLFGLAAAGVLG